MKLLDRVLFGLRLHRLSPRGTAVVAGAIAASLIVPLRLPTAVRSAASVTPPKPDIVAAGPLTHDSLESLPVPSPSAPTPTPSPTMEQATAPAPTSTTRYVWATCWYRTADGVTHYYGCWWPV